MDVDLGALAGLTGLTLHANAYQIHGHGLSGCCLGNLLVASGIEARPATRLYELWAEQRLWGDRVAIRAGQLAADTEFLVSQYATLFVKEELGLDHFEGRSWTGLHRHALMTMLALVFLQRRRLAEAGRWKKAGRATTAAQPARRAGRPRRLPAPSPSTAAMPALPQVISTPTEPKLPK